MAGYFVPRPMPDLDSLRQSEWSSEFEQLMRNRLIMGYFRYEPLIEKIKSRRYKMFDYLKTKVALYEKTGNKEALVDIANMALLEFVAPSHPAAHWGPLDNTEEHCNVH
jgi:hypothetical protein